jgi:hypothetical protein
MQCPHCKENIPWQAVLESLSRAIDAPLNVDERAALIETIEKRRRERGLPPPIVQGRSMKQLQKMAEQAAKDGRNYRLGRSWKQKAH